MVYLLDAIDVAPEKASTFIKIAVQRTRGQDFLELIEELKNSSDVSVTAKDIRERIR